MLETLSQTTLLYDANSTFPTQQPTLKKWSPIVGIIELILTSSAMTFSNIPFVLSPGGTATELYDQYMVGVTQVLDKHAPSISRMTKRQSDEWLSDSYHMARSLRQQFEQMWRKHMTQFNRSRLCKQIAWCNRLANKDKGSYYTIL